MVMFLLVLKIEVHDTQDIGTDILKLMGHVLTSFCIKGRFVQKSMAGDYMVCDASMQCSVREQWLRKCTFSFIENKCIMWENIA